MTARVAVRRIVASVASRVRGSKPGQPQGRRGHGNVGMAIIGPEHDPRSDVPETEAGKIAGIFADAIESGDLKELSDLLAAEIVYLVPGRSEAAGLHCGRDAVTEALAQEVGANTVVSVVEVTELLAGGNRAVVIVRFAGTVDGGSFDYETVFHLRTVDGVVVAITEYSGDQYSADHVARRASMARES